MKLTILTPKNTTKGTLQLPPQFQEPVREDLIKRAVLAIQSHKRQPYGADPEAGKRASAYVSKRRHNYKSTYGIGQSRTPRKVMSFRGTRFNWEGAFAPQTVGGRRAHPPKAEKQWAHKINTKERHKAIRSAMAATLNKELVTARGHNTPEHYPFIADASIEQLSKTKEVKEALITLGFKEDLERAAERKIRAGKGKMRGRRYKTKKSVLIVTGDKCPLLKAASNIPGVDIDIVTITDINAELLAPGAVPGRLTLYTEKAIERLAKEQLFTPNKKKEPATKKEEKKTPAVTTKTTKTTTTKTTKKEQSKTTPKKKTTTTDKQKTEASAQTTDNSAEKPDSSAQKSDVSAQQSDDSVQQSASEVSA